MRFEGTSKETELLVIDEKGDIVFRYKDDFGYTHKFENKVLTIWPEKGNDSNVIKMDFKKIKGGEQEFTLRGFTYRGEKDLDDLDLVKIITPENDSFLVSMGDLELLTVVNMIKRIMCNKIIKIRENGGITYDDTQSDYEHQFEDNALTIHPKGDDSDFKEMKFMEAKDEDGANFKVEVIQKQGEPYSFTTWTGDNDQLIIKRGESTWCFPFPEPKLTQQSEQTASMT